MKSDGQPAASLWKALDYLLRRRTYLLAFRRFRAKPRRPADLSRLIPGLGMGTAGQLVQKLERAGLLQPAGPGGLCALTGEGRRLLQIFETDLRRLDALCRKTAFPARRHHDRGECCDGAWIIRRLLRQRGAMPLLAQMPGEAFSSEQFLSWVAAMPGVRAPACLHLLLYCGLLERSHPHGRLRNYQLGALGRQTQSLLACLHALADETSPRIVAHPQLFCFQPEPEAGPEPATQIA